VIYAGSASGYSIFTAAISQESRIHADGTDFSVDVPALNALTVFSKIAKLEI
jgi:hypothetical protein